jgi:hypothetical protein
MRISFRGVSITKTDPLGPASTASGGRQRGTHARRSAAHRRDIAKLPELLRWDHRACA